jgi:hypothetical protein
VVSAGAVVSDDESPPPHAVTSNEAAAAVAASFQNFFMSVISLINGTSVGTEREKP